MKKILIAFLIFLIGSCGHEKMSSGKQVPQLTGELTYDGLKRTYVYYVPEKVSEHPPLIVALHGGGGSGKDMERLTNYRFNSLAEEEGFVVVYPDAVDKHWNDGRGLSFYTSQANNIDDVGFIEKLIDLFQEVLGIDTTRVYVTGMSNGALMSYRLACEITDRIRAIAPVAAGMGKKLYQQCHPSHGLPVLQIHGTEDPLAPYDGGLLHFQDLPLGYVLSVSETVNYWASIDNCQKESDWIYWKDKYDDGTTVKEKIFSNCDDGYGVKQITIIGGGHTWPDGFQYFPVSLIGITTHEFDGAEVIWDFFKNIE